VFYEPHARDHAILPHDPLTALVAPRPIGWISTLSTDRVPNLAPYSFANVVSSRTPILMFSSNGVKDSMTNALETGEFVWNLATHELRDQMSQSSTRVGAEVDEFGLVGLATAPSRLVAPPRVAASPVAFECRVTQSVQLRNLDGADLDQWLMLGQVVGVHLDERFVLEDGRVDTAALRPLARAGYLTEYAAVTEILHVDRP